MWKPKLTGIFHIYFMEVLMPLEWQMTGLKEGLSRGMTRSNLYCVWEMGYWQVRREAEKLVRRLTVILGWGGGSLELERSDWV